MKVQFKASGSIAADWSDTSDVTCSSFEASPTLNDQLPDEPGLKLITDQKVSQLYVGGTTTYTPGSYKVLFKADVNGVTADQFTSK